MYLCDFEEFGRSLNQWARNEIVECRVNQEVPPGNYQIRYKNKTKAGLALFFQSASTFDTKSGEKYQLRVHPQITQISSNDHYITGGIMEIKGKGFGNDKSKIQFEIQKGQNYSGLNYEILLIEDELIKISVKNDSRDFTQIQKDLVFIGGAGVEHRFINVNMNLSSYLSQQTYPDIPSQTSLSIKLTIESIPQKDLYIQRYSGLFYAQNTGKYKFRVSSDDQSIFKIGAVDFKTAYNESQLQNFCSGISNWTDFRNIFTYFNSEDPNDCAIDLVADKWYYILAIQREGQGGDHLTISVDIPSSNAVGLKHKKPKFSQIKITNNPINEEITIKIKGATSGTFQLAFQARNAQGILTYNKTTENIPYNVSASDLKNYIYTQTSWSMSTTRQGIDIQDNSVVDNLAVGYIWKITFTYFRGETMLPFIVTTNLKGSVTTKVQQSIAPSPLVQGTFQLKINQIITSEIPYNQYTTGFEDILRQMEEIKLIGAKVYQSGNDHIGRIWYIIWDGLDDVSVTIENNLIGGGPPATPATIQHTFIDTTNNSLFYYQIPSDLLRTFHSSTQIALKIGDFFAACVNLNCSYNTLALANVPSINSWSISGTVLTINIQTDYATIDTIGVWNLENLNVVFGGYECKIKSNSILPQILCDFQVNESGNPKIIAGTNQPFVNLKNRGYLQTQQTQNFPLTISSINPNQGSLGGFTKITLLGAGFAENLVVKIDDNICEILEKNNEKIIFLTPPNQLEGLYFVTITQNDLIENQKLFTYQSSLTPTISSLSPTNSSPVLKKDLIISGTNFGTSKEETKVKLISQQTGLNKVDYICNIITITNIEIKCRLGGGYSGSYIIQVINNQGASILETPSSNLFQYKIVVNSITPQIGSIFGGTLLTITGENFSTDLQDNQVLIGPLDETYLCHIETATSTQLTCTVPAINSSSTLAEQQLTVEIRGKIVELASCVTGCNFTYQNATTPKITSISSLTGKGGDNLTFTGTNLLGTVKITFYSIDQNYQITTFSQQTDTELIFTLPEIPSSNYNIKVFVENKGYSQLPINSIFTNNAEVLTIIPSTGNYGGQSVTITGHGFASTDEVYFNNGSILCLNKQFISSAIIKCKTPVLTENQTFNVSVKRATNVFTCNCNFQTITNLHKLTAITQKEFTTPTSFILQFTVTEISVADITKVTFKLRSITNSDVFYDGTLTNVGGSVSAQFSNVAIGDYLPEFFIEEIGFLKLTYSNPKEISIDFATDLTMSQIESSFLGGSKGIITGIGFSNNKKDIEISICGIPGEILTSSFNQIEFETPALLNTLISQTFSIKLPKKVKPQIISGINGTNAAYLNDNNYYTYFSSSSYDCQAIYDFGSSYRVLIDKISFFPRFKINFQDLKGSLIEGSIDGITYTTLITVDDKAIENWNEYFPDENVVWEYRFIRFKGNKCLISEFSIYGTLTYNGTIDLNATNCQVKIKLSGNEAILDDKVIYKQLVTPTISSISPQNGSIAGNTSVNIQGTNFDSSCIMIIDNVNCPIQNQTSTLLTCLTGARTTLVENQTIIKCSKGKAALGQNQFTYLEKWSLQATWGNELLPLAEESILVPKGQTLLVDISPPKLQLVVIEGTLIFDDTQDINFDAHYIMVNEGKMIAGSEETPYQHKLIITLHGKITDKTLPGTGNKTISVMNGILDFHGKPKTPTWTHLDLSANPGDLTISLKEVVNWEIGEEIVLAITGRNLSEFETKKITAISTNKKILTLDSPIQYKHYAGTLTYDGKDYNLRGEVGLLSRNIVIQGDDDTIQSKYGVHVMFRGKPEKVLGRFSYVELRKCGQAFQMGRYPIHYHMIGNVAGSYIKGHSVHHSFNRGTTIHGVHYLQILNGVYYLHMGHGIFWEDSIETKNLVEGNLVMGTKVSSSLLMSDLKPASFWITRPINYIRGNTAVGSEFFGFWFDLPNAPTGPSATDGICPVGEELGQFENNQAHGNGIGLRVYPQFLPRTFPCRSLLNEQKENILEDNPPKRATFKGVLLWNNDTGFFVKEAGSLTLLNFTFISNSRAIAYEIPEYQVKSAMPSLENSIIVGKSPAGDFHGFFTNLAIHAGKKEGFKIQGVKFINFDSNSTFLVTCMSCDESGDKEQKGMAPSYFSQLSFENAAFGQMIQFHLPEHGKDLIIDEDGTLFNHFNKNKIGFILPYFKHLENNSCELITDSAICTFKCLLCPSTVPLKRLEFEMTDTDMSGYTLKIFNKNTQGEFSNNIQEENKFSNIKYIRTKDSWRGWAFPVIMETPYNFHWHLGYNFKNLQILNNHYWINTDTISLNFNLTATRELYDVFYTGLNSTSNFVQSVFIEPKTSLPLISSNFGENYWNQITDNLVIRASGIKFGQVKIQEIVCRNNCPKEPDNPNTEEDKYRYWSKKEDWQNGVVPGIGENVKIEPTWKMVVDIDTAILNTLDIQGKLYFLDEFGNRILQAKNIIIRSNGILYFGTDNLLYTKNSKIILHGKLSDEEIVLNPTLIPSNKSIIILGKLQAKVQTSQISQTRLRESALKGQRVLIVKESIDWKVGDEIVIASTSQKHEEAEKGKIFQITGNQIVLESDLLYNHFGSSTTTTTGLGSFDMRAEVALLTRNVVISGSTEDNWGCHIQVAGYSSIPDGTALEGQINIQGVQIDNCGQRDTEKSALDMLFLIDTNKANKIENCSITNSIGWGINVKNSNNIVFNNNVIYSSLKYGVYMKTISNVIFSKNIIIQIKERPWYSNVQEFDLLIGFFYDGPDFLNIKEIVIKDNVISSSPWFAWVMPGKQCDGSQNNFSGNSAHSSRAGWFGSKINVDCQKYESFTAYRNWEQGFVNRHNIMELQVEKFILADNNNSIALNGGSQSKKDFPKSSIKDSVIYGKVLQDCDFCYNNKQDCDTNGIYTSLFEASKFEMIFNEQRLPLHNVTMPDFLWGGYQTISNVEFKYFQKKQTCQDEKSFVIRTNNFIQDTSAYISLKFLTMSYVDHKNKFFFANHTRLKNSSFCSKRDCTGIYNTMIDDNNGVFDLENKPFQYFGYNKNIANDGNCTFVEEWNGHQCLRNYQLQSIKKTFQDRSPIISPIYTTIYQNDANLPNEKLYKNTIDNETEFPNLIKKNSFHQIQFSQSMPNNNIYKLDSFNDQDWAVFKIQNQDPATLVTIVNNSKIKPIVTQVDSEIIWSNYKDQCGAHVFFPSNSTLIWLMNSRADCVVTVNQLKTVNIAMRLDINVFDFYSNIGELKFIDKIAALLEIHPSQLKIVGVRQGSTIIDFYIENSQKIENSAATEQNKNLVMIENTLKEKVSSGLVDFSGVKILGVQSSVTVPLNEDSGFTNFCRFYNFTSFNLITNSQNDLKDRNNGIKFLDTNCNTCTSVSDCQNLRKDFCEKNLNFFTTCEEPKTTDQNTNNNNNTTKYVELRKVIFLIFLGLFM